MVSINRLKTKPLHVGDRPWVEWTKVLGLQVAALATVGAFAIPFDSPWRPVRMGLRVVGMAAAAASILKTRQIQYAEKYWSFREVMREDEFLEAQAEQFRVEEQPPIVDMANIGEHLNLYQWENLPDESTGIMIAGNSGAGKTSVCVWVLGLLTKAQPAIIEVLDIHAGINQIWRDLGLRTISKVENIQERLEFALEELDHRRELAEQGKRHFEPYIFVCDELDGCYKRFAKPKVIDDALSILGKEGRKYNLTLIFISHTSSVSNKAIDSQEKNSYITIGLGATARAISHYQFKKDTLESRFLNAQAYPCVVTSSGLTTIALHPTHHTYQQYKIKGNPPLNLLPINQLNPQAHEAHYKNTGNTERELLERLYRMECTDLGTQSTLGTQGTQHPEIGVSCPRCGSSQINKKGVYQRDKSKSRYQCKKCGKNWVAN